MHFGRLAKDQGIDLSLPPLMPRTEGYLRLGHQGRRLVYAGAPIWAEKEWVGSLYADGTRPRDFLREYAKNYATVEYNGSFYHLPAAQQVRQWTSMVGPEFRFCPKVPKDISHQLAGGFDSQLLKEYLDRCAAFGEHYGMSFLQLPDSFGPSAAPALQKLLAAWSREWPLAIEFRHPAWFKDHMLLDPVIDQLYRSRVSAVITDTPGRRDVVHSSLTFPQLIVRFLGCFPSARDEERLAAWADRLKMWTDAGLDSVYFFIHQERHGAIPASLSYLQRRLMEKDVAGLMRPAQSDENQGEESQNFWL